MPCTPQATPERPTPRVALLMPAALGAMSLLLSASAPAQGSLVTWGDDTFGAVSAAPVGGHFVAVTPGESWSMALRDDGSIVAWGTDTGGCVSGAPTGTGFTAIAAGNFHGYALAADGSIVAWGSDVLGQVSETPAGTGFTSIAAGAEFGYAVAADGSIEAWGDDSEGQVSNAPTGTDFVEVKAAWHTALALRNDGSIAAWGWDIHSVVSGAPVGTGFTDIAFGDEHALALGSDGSIVAWGNISGTPADTGFVALAAGPGRGYALRADGSIAAWGSDAGGQLSGEPAGSASVIAGGPGSHVMALLLPPTIPFAPKSKHCSLADKAVAGKDSIRVRGSWTIASHSPDGVIDPLSEDVIVRLGSYAEPWKLVLSAGSPGWKATKTGFRYKSPKGVLPRLSMVLNATKGTLALKASRLDLPTSANPFGIDLRIGDDTLTWWAQWVAQKKAGAFKFTEP